MNVISFNSIEPLKASKFLLLGISAGLITIHLNNSWKSNDTDLFFNSIIYLTSVCYLIKTKFYKLNIKTGVISSLLGTLIIAFALLKSTEISINFLYVSPLISAVGVSLLASGFKGLKQYRSELLVLFFLGVPHVTIYWLIDLSEITAKFAAFVLWYLGFEVSRQGVNIILPMGGLEVYQGCSGMKNILELWGLAILLLVMFPTDWMKRILVPFMAIFIGFVVNGFRVVLMGVLVASSNQTGFEYWHKGDGSLIFSMISVLIFGLFCFFGLRLDEGKTKNQDSVSV